MEDYLFKYKMNNLSLMDQFLPCQKYTPLIHYTWPYTTENCERDRKCHSNKKKKGKTCSGLDLALDKISLKQNKQTNYSFKPYEPLSSYWQSHPKCHWIEYVYPIIKDKNVDTNKNIDKISM